MEHALTLDISEDGGVFNADSDDPAHPFRGIPARDSDLIPPTYSD